MKQLLFATIIFSQIFLLSCTDRKTTYHLTDEQKAMLQLINPGDIVLWESNTGVRDTAVVLPFIYDEAMLRSPGSFDNGDWAEQITVNYMMIGKNKLGPVPSIRITADSHHNLIPNTFTCGGYICDGTFANKKIGNRSYPLVFWRLDGNPNDTIFWNVQGYLGYNKSDGSSANKIR
jgi:hypothetical protein